MKKIILKGIILPFLVLSLFSCESDDNNDPWVEPEISTTGAFILNSGNFYGNDASLSFYNIDNQSLTTDVFANINNGLRLGDQAQDMAIYGSKMYITVTNSNKIYITDLSAKLLETIEPEFTAKVNEKDVTQNMEPRSIATHKGKVYVSTYSGHVLRIDTATMSIEKQIKIGTFLEQMTIVKENLYVTHSRDLNDSISIISLSSFSKTGKIKVEVNPDMITSDKYGNIYVISQGDYGQIKPTLQKIDPETKEVSVIGTNVASRMVANGDKLYLLHVDYVNPTKLSSYDIVKDKLEPQSFVIPPNETALNDASSISINPVNNEFYITTNTYPQKGNVYVFSADGKYKTNFAAGGYFPNGVFFVTSVK